MLAQGVGTESHPGRQNLIGLNNSVDLNLSARCREFGHWAGLVLGVAFVSGDSGRITRHSENGLESERATSHFPETAFGEVGRIPPNKSASIWQPHWDCHFDEQRSEMLRVPGWTLSDAWPLTVAGIVVGLGVELAATKLAALLRGCRYPSHVSRCAEAIFGLLDVEHV
jgi:hypothetical protein